MKVQLLIASLALALLPFFLVANLAEAVTCAKGAHRAGCAGPNGAVVTAKPAPATTCRIVNGVRVCKSHW